MYIPNSETRTMLVTGGSGYLAQFVVQELAKQGRKVGCTYRNAEQPPKFSGDVTAYRVDLATGEGLNECLDALGPLAAVVNCAAMAAPAACEQDEAAARAVNIPTRLLDAMQRHAAQHGSQPLLIHISTDHVYEGSRSFYKEDAELLPVNKYGRSKVDGERLVQQRWPRHAILRPSIIFGPQPPNPISRGQFLAYIDSSLAAQKPTTFFDDEWRTPTYVADLVAAILALLDKADSLPSEPQHARIFNVGCPERLNRVDMALGVAEVRGYDPALVLPGSASSVPRTCATPTDISMDCSAVQAALGLRMTPFKQALRQIFAADSG